MSKRIPLDALIRRVSRMAEQMFDKQGDIDPLWLVENARGEQHMIVSPIIADSPLEGADLKDRIADKMREYFAEHDIVRYGRATECWTLKEGSTALGDADNTEQQHALRYAAMGYTLKDHPDRREVVQIEAADGGELIWAFRDIIRPAQGNPYLGKMSDIIRPERVAGRFLDLLPSKERDAALRERPPEEEPRRIRFTRELAEGVVGNPFMTAVPDAPIQLTGWREEATGELYVDSIMGAPKGAPWPLPDIPPVFEIVTGPEAERFILSMHRWLTEQAEAEGLTLDEYSKKYSQQKPKP